LGKQVIINCILILLGTIVMVISTIRAGNLMKAVPLVPQRHRRHIKVSLIFHRMLMIFFSLGYLVVMGAFAFRYTIVSDTFVSIIFLLGAVFVFIGLLAQSSLLKELQRTLQGILPICSKCKKVRALDGDPKDPATWKEIESYISEKTDAGFSHGYCPACFEAEMDQILKVKG